MTAPETPGRLEAAWQYLEHVAGIVLLGVDEAGTIRWSNRHARDLGGLALAGEPIDRLFLNFRNAPIWTELRLAPGRVCLLNARTISGLPETYYVTCVLTSEGPLVFGQTDAVEQARLRREVLALSREAAEMTRELARRNGELAERNEEKNRFLGMATHDLRRPVDLVLGCVEMLLDELATGLDEEHLRLLRTIHTATRGMARVIDDFLDVAAIDSGRLGLDAARCRVEHLLAEAIALNAAPARSRGIRIEAAPTLATIVLHADGPKIGQVFENLLSNAVEHAPDGSTVRVECRREG
ncbi:MAG: HAMP domain-containing histidine kinase, partial [Thermoanaerobaculia bacterium]|nr:HAMP domain-containing histidine kinase [Thermoanaerobaculia bacterium]